MVSGPLGPGSTGGGSVARKESSATLGKESSDRPGPKWRKRFRVAGWFALLLFILTGLAYLFRAPLLTAVAESWIVHEPEFEWVDAVVVPGGGLETRPFQAAKLFHAGKTDTIITFRTQLMPTNELGITPEHHELNVSVLKGLQVPESAIILIGDGVASTWEEATACREWMEKEGKESLAVMTEIFPSRRVKWSYDRACDGTKSTVWVWAISPRKYDANSWWQDEAGVIAFQNEVIKYAYYQLRF